MRWLINVVKALVVLALVLAVVGLLLPGRRHVERGVEIRATPAEVWPWLAEPRRWTAWSPWYAKDPQMQLSYEGPERGAGAGWRWTSKSQGRGQMRFVSAQPPQSLAYALSFEGMGTAQGDFVLTPAGEGTRVVWRFDTDLGLNPLARWFGLGMDHLLGGDMEAGLGKLAEQVQARAAPAPQAASMPR